jgi:hypothetical protein
MHPLLGAFLKMNLTSSLTTSYNSPKSSMDSTGMQKGLGGDHELKKWWQKCGEEE